MCVHPCIRASLSPPSSRLPPPPAPPPTPPPPPPPPRPPSTTPTHPQAALCLGALSVEAKEKEAARSQGGLRLLVTLLEREAAPEAGPEGDAVLTAVRHGPAVALP